MSDTNTTTDRAERIPIILSKFFGLLIKIGSIGDGKSKFEPWGVRSDTFMHKVIMYRRLVAFLGLSKKYSYTAQIEKLKNRHLGERCFIVCTGPSLTKSDVEKLSGETTFAVNSIIDLYPETDWRPTYYAVVDSYAFSKYLADEPVYGGSYAKRESFFHYRINPLSKSGAIVKLPVSYVNHKPDRMKKNRIRLSSNPSVCIYDAFSVAIMAIQLCVYMGFKDIYLIGADSDYSDGAKHYKQSKMDTVSEGEKDYAEIVKLSTVGYEAARRFACKHGVNIYNATRGGKLNVFPRVDFDSLFVKEVKE